MSEVRDQPSKLQGLLDLSMLLTECSDERKISELVAEAMPSLGRSHLCGIYAIGRGWVGVIGPCNEHAVRTDLEAQFTVLSQAGGEVAILQETWAWAFTLRSLDDHLGYLVVGADREPPADEQFLLQALAQQTGTALANVRRQITERATASELRTTNAALARTVSTLERSTLVHERLDQVAIAGVGPHGVADAVREFTHLSVAVEDTHGNLRAWAGPGRPDPYPKDRSGRRDRLLDKARRERRPIRAGGRLLAVAGRGDQVLGVLVLIDPGDSAGPGEKVVLAHGATVLTIELGRERDVAETELRLGRGLVADLIAGADAGRALARAEALGYDLARMHRVLITESLEAGDSHQFLHAVRRAARDTGVGTLLAEHEGAVVVLADTDASSHRGVTSIQSAWERLRDAIVEDPGGARCRIGVGEPCEDPADFPRSYREARLALTIQAVTGGYDRPITFGDLGVFRLFAEAPQISGVEQFVREWLGSLIDYDTDNRSSLVATLSSYLECGGNYDATARDLAIHRSTIKYRLRRIREITGRDLADPDTHFNLQLATRAWQTLVALRGV